MVYRVAMIDYDYDSLEHIEKTLARYDVELQAQHSKDLDDARRFAHDADGVIVQKLGPINEGFIGSLKKCRVLARTGVGLDPIDVPAATKYSMCVVHVKDYCVEEVSDHTIALLLTLARKTSLYTASVKSGSWDFNAGRPIWRLKGQTLGLIGFGKIPTCLVPKAKGFGIEIVAYDPYVKSSEMKDLGVRKVKLDELLKSSDFVSLHAPLTHHTQGIIGKKQLSKMKKTAFVINTARGPLIEESALVEALQRGEIAGAALDVMWQEPPPLEHPLLKMDNVVIAPHAGYYSEQSLVDLHVQLAQNVGDVLTGKRPKDLANPGVLDKVKLD